MDQNLKNKIIYALEKLPTDLRDFSHHKNFGTLGASQLPVNDFTIYDSFQYTVVRGDTLSAIAYRFGFSLSQILIANPKITDPNKIYVGETITIPERPRMILNQLDLDFCTAFTTAELQYALFGVPIDPLYQMAKIKEIRGEYTQYGASLRDACASAVTYGSLPLVLGPYTHNGSATDKTRDFLANWLNWPIGLDKTALKYKDMSYFTVDGIYDVFDNIRSMLQIHLQERRGVTFGLYWHDEWTEAPGGVIPIIMPTDTPGGPHDMAVIGQKTINGVLYLVFQQTWGLTAGDNGRYYFPREIVDLCSREGYGAFILSRIDKSGVTGFGWLVGLITSLFNHA